MSDKEKVFTSKTGQKYIINTPQTGEPKKTKTAEEIKRQVKELKK
jgi:hypothetical protein